MANTGRSFKASMVYGKVYGNSILDLTWHYAPTSSLWLMPKRQAGSKPPTVPPHGIRGGLCWIIAILLVGGILPT
ncbi:hypothetical protein F5X97DRAFT_311095 [Nemania serpens]|nr:hypothetical protein F5X97DRAFT_311095 [Nemania serpens]